MTIFSETPKPSPALRRAYAQAANQVASPGIKQRSKTVVIATETPVQRFDDYRGEVINEVLLMSGVEFRTDKRQLPIVDSYDTSTVRNIVGSVRNIRVDGTRLIGEVYWASDAEAQAIAAKWAEGHLSDFSITGAPKEILGIERGQKWRSIEGPADIIVRWTPLDASIVAAGADPNSRGM